MTSFSNAKGSYEHAFLEMMTLKAAFITKSDFVELFRNEPYRTKRFEGHVEYSGRPWWQFGRCADIKMSLRIKEMKTLKQLLLACCPVEYQWTSLLDSSAYTFGLFKLSIDSAIPHIFLQTFCILVKLRRSWTQCTWFAARFPQIP